MVLSQWLWITLDHHRHPYHHYIITSLSSSSSSDFDRFWYRRQWISFIVSNIWYWDPKIYEEVEEGSEDEEEESGEEERKSPRRKWGRGRGGDSERGGIALKDAIGPKVDLKLDLQIWYNFVSQLQRFGAPFVWTWKVLLNWMMIYGREASEGINT